MNITNAEYFTFNAHNSLLLVGQSGSGKSHLVHELVKRYESAFKPGDMKYAIFDLKQCEFSVGNEDGAKQEYLLFDVENGNTPSYGFDRLEELAAFSKDRAENNIQKPFVFIYIEECDMACRDQKRFDKLVTVINKNAKKANMKLVYSTSSPRLDTVSNKLLKSFELVLIGNFSYDNWLYEYFGISKESRPTLSDYEFLVVER